MPIWLLEEDFMDGFESSKFMTGQRFK